MSAALARRCAPRAPAAVSSLVLPRSLQTTRALGSGNSVLLRRTFSAAGAAGRRGLALESRLFPRQRAHHVPKTARVTSALNSTGNSFAHASTSTVSEEERIVAPPMVFIKVRKDPDRYLSPVF
jgi:hypothetical protein